jgi:hypothetical protein
MDSVGRQHRALMLLGKLVSPNVLCIVNVGRKKRGLRVLSNELGQAVHVIRAGFLLRHWSALQTLPYC